MHVLELISKQLRCLFGRDVTKVWLGHQFLSIFELRQTLRFKNPRHATKTRSRRVWCEICLGSGWDFHLVKIPLVLGSEDLGSVSQWNIPWDGPPETGQKRLFLCLCSRPGGKVVPNNAFFLEVQMCSNQQVVNLIYDLLLGSCGLISFGRADFRWKGLKFIWMERLVLGIWCRNS